MDDPRIDQAYQHVPMCDTCGGTYFHGPPCVDSMDTRMAVTSEDRTATLCSHCGEPVTYRESTVTSARWKYYHPKCRDAGMQQG